MNSLRCGRGGRRHVGSCLLVAVLLSWAAGANAQEVETLASLKRVSATHDWPWWRGPLRNGVAAQQSPPTHFSDTQALKWKIKVPGRGHSSPIVVGESVFLTTADEKTQRQSVLAFERATGKLRWESLVNTGGFPEKNHPKNTEATSTLACDGEHLFACFFHHQTIELVTLGLDGKLGWRKTVGVFNPRRYEYGYAPSPLIYRDTVIVAAEHDGESYIAALRRSDGSEAWRIRREPMISFSSPVVTHVAGRDQLLISGNNHIVSYDPANGELIWTSEGTSLATCGTMVWEGDRVFASGGYPKSETIALDAKQGEVLWRNDQKCYEQSLITVDGYVYGLTDRGILICWRATDGHEMWRQRLSGPVSASPVYAGGAIYWANEAGMIYVFRPNAEKYDPVAENQIGDAAFPSPAMVDGQIFLRVSTGLEADRQEWLYCFAN